MNGSLILTCVGRNYCPLPLDWAHTTTRKGTHKDKATRESLDGCEGHKQFLFPRMNFFCMKAFVSLVS